MLFTTIRSNEFRMKFWPIKRQTLALQIWACPPARCRAKKATVGTTSKRLSTRTEMHSMRKGLHDMLANSRRLLRRGLRRTHPLPRTKPSMKFIRCAWARNPMR